MSKSKSSVATEENVMKDWEFEMEFITQVLHNALTRAAELIATSAAEEATDADCEWYENNVKKSADAKRERASVLLAEVRAEISRLD